MSGVGTFIVVPAQQRGEAALCLSGLICQHHSLCFLDPMFSDFGERFKFPIAVLLDECELGLYHLKSLDLARIQINSPKF
jgi:hypothetical protein